MVRPLKSDHIYLPFTIRYKYVTNSGWGNKTHWTGHPTSKPFYTQHVTKAEPWIVLKRWIHIFSSVQFGLVTSFQFWPNILSQTIYGTLDLLSPTEFIHIRLHHAFFQGIHFCKNEMYNITHLGVFRLSSINWMRSHWRPTRRELIYLVGISS